MDAPTTASGGPWMPVAPSHFVRPNDNIVAGFMGAQELALWRSQDGVVQAWENRCPHRGTRLTLGRIVKNKLSCAYHGWEFAANGGKCTGIPAHPSSPVPKQLCVKTYSAVEQDGMVWVAAGQPGDRPASIEHVGAPSANTFVRSLGITVQLDVLKQALTSRGLTAAGPLMWSGVLDEHRIAVFLTEAGPELCFAHIWTSGVDSQAAGDALFFARELRSSVEQLLTPRG